MSNPPINPIPLPDNDRAVAEGLADPGSDPRLIEQDGERILDPDLDDEAIDSAEADRLASGADTEDGAS